MMNGKTEFADRDLRDLGYYHLLEIVAEKAGSEPGADFIKSLKPSSDPGIVKNELILVDEARKILVNKGYPPVHGLHDYTSVIQSVLPEGTYLDVPVLLGILNELKLFVDLKKYFSGISGSPVLSWVDLPDFGDLIKDLEKVIDDKGDIRDSASKKLRNLRNEKRRMETRIDAVLARYFKSVEYVGILRERQPTIRSGRFVIPLRAGSQRKIRGIIHDHSASGGTVYLEPMESVPLNNELRRLEDEEKREILVILRRMTSRIRERADDFLTTTKIAVRIDALFARAYYAEEEQCSIPEVADYPVIVLSNARHPLLLRRERRGGRKTVPMSISLGDDIGAIIVTGPNAGGKTVVLKTVGLLVLMNQTGIPIPAGADSKIGSFTGVYVDIGDGQSVENDLSTFSASMQNISRIIRSAAENTLVLLDELGAGTDPVEGAALGMEIVKELLEKEALIVATTHLGKLKFMAGEIKGIENASMEFDLEKLEPVYKLRMGIPGRSFALNIAERSGIPRELVKRASFLVRSGGEKDVDELVREMENRLSELHKKIEKYNSMLEEQKARESLLDLREQQVERSEKSIKRKLSGDIERVVSDIRKDLERTIKEIRETRGNLTAEKIKLARKKVDMVARKADRLGTSVQPNRKPDSWIPKPGERVRVTDYDMIAVIVSVDLKRNRVKVERKGVTIDVPLSGIEAESPGDDSPYKKSERVFASFPQKGIKVRMSDSVPQLDVRGKTVDEAWIDVARAVDAALMDGLREIRIIHGKGTGRLRAGLTELLVNDPRVVSVKIADYFSGGDGVSIVELG